MTATGFEHRPGSRLPATGRPFSTLACCGLALTAPKRRLDIDDPSR